MPLDFPIGEVPLLDAAFQLAQQIKRRMIIGRGGNADVTIGHAKGSDSSGGIEPPSGHPSPKTITETSRSSGKLVIIIHATCRCLHDLMETILIKFFRPAPCDISTRMVQNLI